MFRRVCVGTNYGTRSIILKIRVGRFVKSYPHCVISPCVKKKFRFTNWMKFLFISRNALVRTWNGCDIYIHLYIPTNKKKTQIIK